MSTAPCPLAHPHALETADACLLEHKWPASATKDLRDTIVLRKLAPTTAPTTENALMECALATMGGEVKTVQGDAQEMANVATETESVLKENATATQDGVGMPVMSELACTIARNTDTAKMELVFAKRDTEAETALSLLNPNLANAQSTVCVAASNNVPRFTKPKELDLPMSATLSAPKNVFLNVLREKCL